jgi:hypothetical protein
VLTLRHFSDVLTIVRVYVSHEVRAFGRVEIEHLIRYAERAVGLKPSAIECKARLRGLYQIICSKTISPRLCKAKPAYAGYSGVITQRP